MSRFPFIWRATTPGLFLLIFGVLMAAGALSLWGGATRSAASAAQTDPRNNPYPGRYDYLPIINYLPAPTATPPPTLFVGERNVWDGKGYLRLDEYQEVGTHLVRELDQMTAPDTIRSNNHHWYDPNPNQWEEEYWYTYYSTQTNRLLSSSAPPDTAWKFGHPWVMPASWNLESGQTHEIDRQRFSVSGPFSGATAFGRPIQFWVLENQSSILYWDSSDGWTQIVRAGNLELWYDAGSTRLLIFSDVLRSFYYNGSSTGYNVQYGDQLTYSNAFKRDVALTAPGTYQALPDNPPAISAEGPTDLPIADNQVGLPPPDSLRWIPPGNPQNN